MALDQNDPIQRLSHQRIIKLSADIEAQLMTLPGGGVAMEVLRRLKERAAESLTALSLVDTEEPKQIRALQNEVKRYDEWIGWLREIVLEGKAYDRQMTEDDREELLDLLVGTDEGRREAIELGLVDDVSRGSE